MTRSGLVGLLCLLFCVGQSLAFLGGFRKEVVAARDIPSEQNDGPRPHPQDLRRAWSEWSNPNTQDTQGGGGGCAPTTVYATVTSNVPGAVSTAWATTTITAGGAGGGTGGEPVTVTTTVTAAGGGGGGSGGGGTDVNGPSDCTGGGGGGGSDPTGAAVATVTSTVTQTLAGNTVTSPLQLYDTTTVLLVTTVTVADHTITTIIQETVASVTVTVAAPGESASVTVTTTSYITNNATYMTVIQFPTVTTGPGGSTDSANASASVLNMYQAQADQAYRNMIGAYRVTTPWWAVFLIVLFILVGLLLLAVLFLFIFRKHWFNGTACPNCGEPGAKCTCPVAGGFAYGAAGRKSWSSSLNQSSVPPGLGTCAACDEKHAVGPCRPPSRVFGHMTGAATGAATDMAEHRRSSDSAQRTINETAYATMKRRRFENREDDEINLLSEPRHHHDPRRSSESRGTHENGEACRCMRICELDHVNGFDGQIFPGRRSMESTRLHQNGLTIGSNGQADTSTSDLQNTETNHVSRLEQSGDFQQIAAAGLKSGSEQTKRGSRTTTDHQQFSSHGSAMDSAQMGDIDRTDENAEARNAISTTTRTILLGKQKSENMLGSNGKAAGLRVQEVEVLPTPQQDQNNFRSEYLFGNFEDGNRPSPGRTITRSRSAHLYGNGQLLQTGWSYDEDEEDFKKRQSQAFERALSSLGLSKEDYMIAAGRVAQGDQLSLQTSTTSHGGGEVVKSVQTSISRQPLSRAESSRIASERMLSSDRQSQAYGSISSADSIYKNMHRSSTNQSFDTNQMLANKHMLDSREISRQSSTAFSSSTQETYLSNGQLARSTHMDITQPQPLQIASTKLPFDSEEAFESQQHGLVHTFEDQAHEGMNLAVAEKTVLENILKNSRHSGVTQTTIQETTPRGVKITQVSVDEVLPTPAVEGDGDLYAAPREVKT